MARDATVLARAKDLMVEREDIWTRESGGVGE